MKKLVVTLALLLVAAGKDEDAIKKIPEDFAAAWGKPDAAKKMAALFAEDGDLVNPVGQEADGRAAVEQLFEKEQGQMFKGSTLVLTVSKVRMIKPDVALAEGTFDLTGVHMPDGKPGQAQKGLYTMIAVKQKGKWMISALRPMSPPPMPGPPKAPTPPAPPAPTKK
jgi:uncharacterized protein (TIGR02246 family)